jgi:hypothetical protein
MDLKAFETVEYAAEGIFRDTTGAHKDYHKSITGPLFINYMKIE